MLEKKKSGVNLFKFLAAEQVWIGVQIGGLAHCRF
jgi:hypothetical protein